MAARLARAPSPLPRLVEWAASEVFVARVSELARLMRADGDPVVAAVDEGDLAAVGGAFLAVLRAESSPW